MDKTLKEKMTAEYKRRGKEEFLTWEDVIEICAQVAEQHYQGKWIAVETRLPEDMSEVLFVVNGRIANGRFYQSDQWERKNMFVCTQGGFYSSGNKVTHWQPLPAPPKEN